MIIAILIIVIISVATGSYDGARGSSTLIYSILSGLYGSLIGCIGIVALAIFFLVGFAQEFALLAYISFYLISETSWVILIFVAASVVANVIGFQLGRERPRYDGADDFEQRIVDQRREMEAREKGNAHV